MHIRALIVSALFAATSVAVAQPRYEVIDLTELFGQFFFPSNINNAGQIGASIAQTGPSQACVVEPDLTLRSLPHYKGLTWGMTELADTATPWATTLSAKASSIRSCTEAAR
ncbi:MAG: hypothetical protein M3R13_11405 [Armatimonadota bacterium]|nr:hypothetical protein [Armatimonadota bacterium]